LRAEPFDTRAETAFEVIFEAGPRQFSVDLDIAGAKLESAVDEVECFPRRIPRQERAVVVAAVADDVERENYFWDRFVRELQMRVLLVILEHHVETRLVLFDQVRFENQGLDLIVDNDVLKIGDQLVKLAGL